MKVRMSNVNKPDKPITGNSAPASNGAMTPGPASISDTRPFARPSCSLPTIRLMLAE
jgi:hypothetical protein